MKKTYFSLVSSALLLIITFFAFAATSVAWFGLNRNINASQMQLYPVDDNLHLDYKIFAYNSELEYAEEVTDRLSTISLPAYDSVILERNKNTSLIIQLVITAEVEINRLSNLQCKIYCSEEDSAKHVLSNITCFKILQLNISSNDPNIIYSEASTQFEKCEDKYTFIQDSSKNLEIIMNLSNYDITNDELVFYIGFNYDADLIEELGGFNVDDFDLIWDYTSDIDKLEIMERD